MKKLLKKSVLISLISGLFVFGFIVLSSEVNQANTIVTTTNSIPAVSWNTVTTYNSVYSPATVGWVNPILPAVSTPVYYSPAAFAYPTISPVMPMVVY